MIKFSGSNHFILFTCIKLFGLIHFGAQGELWDIFHSRWWQYKLDVKLSLQPRKVICNQTIQASQVRLSWSQSNNNYIDSMNQIMWYSKSQREIPCSFTSGTASNQSILMHSHRKTQQIIDNININISLYFYKI